MTENKVIEILEKRLSTIDGEIARADNNARIAMNNSRTLKKFKLDLVKAIKVLQPNMKERR